MRVDVSQPSPDNTKELLQWVENNCADSKELFANGCTPINGVLRDMLRYYSNEWVPPSPTPGGAAVPSPLTSVANGERACRSVNVILIADSQETCDTLANAVDAAADLFAGFTKDGITWKIRTFIVDFGDLGNWAHPIAEAGGTVAAQIAANEASLSTALSDILGNAVSAEVCDGADNSCNGCIDEGACP